MLTVGVEKYPGGSGFDTLPLPYAEKSGKDVEDFFAGKENRAEETYALVRVWPGLYGSNATREAIRSRLAEDGEQNEGR